jgi:hypothetical protein
MVELHSTKQCRVELKTKTKTVKGSAMAALLLAGNLREKFLHRWRHSSSVEMRAVFLLLNDFESETSSGSVFGAKKLRQRGRCDLESILQISFARNFGTN